MTRIAIISDVHAFKPDPGSERFAERDPSWVRTIPDDLEASRGPFQSLETMIREEGIAADVLVSCGDMGDKADHHGVMYTWSYLETIRRRIGASDLVATTGNHDMDSRDSSGRSDPAYLTRSLQPPFPMDDANVCDDYWTKHVALFTNHGTDFVIVNTAAEHQTTDVAKRGRISDKTLQTLQEVVSTTTSDKRVLVAHHHPYRHDAIDRTDYSEMDGGPELLRILQEDGDWLVIHGHRHYPNIAYAAGGARAPVIFAAGSFSARLYPELQTRVRNQFHVVELASAGAISGTSGLVGCIRSWEWTATKGWTRPRSEEGIPDQAGFGYRRPLDEAASTIEDFVLQTEDRYVVLEAVFKQHEALRHLIPVDREAVLREVKERGRVAVSPDEHFSQVATEIFLTGVGT